MAGFRITELWAFVGVDPDDDDEGVVAAPLAGGRVLPLIAADRDRLDALRPEAQRVADMIGRPLFLVRFASREAVEVLPPVAPPGWVHRSSNGGGS